MHVFVNVLRYLKHFQQSFLLYLQPFEWLFLLDDFLTQVLQTWEIIAGHTTVHSSRDKHISDTIFNTFQHCIINQHMVSSY